MTELHFAENIRARFFTRTNGVSEGDFASLNCSIKVGDEPAKVRENMRRVAKHCGVTVEKLFVLHQHHSTDVVVVDKNEPFAKTPFADALVTAVPNVCLGIKTADCAPVLLADEEAGVVGAAHAGWRGAAFGVLENTIEAMVSLGAEASRIAALVGPCIAPQSYDVGEDMRREFLQADLRSDLFFTSVGTGKYRFDLPGYVLARLERLGIEAAEWVGEDTYALESKYFSHRRSSQKGRPCGRQISVIGLLDDSLF